MTDCCPFCLNTRAIKISSSSRTSHAIPSRPGFPPRWKESLVDPPQFLECEAFIEVETEAINYRKNTLEPETETITLQLSMLENISEGVFGLS